MIFIHAIIFASVVCVYMLCVNVHDSSAHITASTSSTNVYLFPGKQGLPYSTDDNVNTSAWLIIISTYIRQ